MNKKFVDLEFVDIVLIILKKKLFIFLSTLFFICLGFVYAFSVDEVYQSSTRFIAKENNNSISSALDSLPTLSAISGLGGSSTSKNTIIAEELITSKEFVIDMLVDNDLLNYFYAFKSWDKKNNKVIFDDSLLINKENFIKNLNEIETRIVADEIFSSYLDLINLKKNKNGVYTVTFDYYSPYFAKQFLEILLQSINEQIRINDLSKSEKAINFLNQQLETSSNNFIKESVGRLIEANLNIKMMAVISVDGYVFDFLEKPSLNGKKVYPSKRQIILLSLLIGFIFSVTLVLITLFLKEIRNKK